MVLASHGLLLTPPPSSSPPKTPHWSYSAQTRSQNEEKKHPPQTVPAPTDENLTYIISQTPSDVQSRRAPGLINTCHDARFAPHGREGLGRHDVESDGDGISPRAHTAKICVCW
jgi:hypothetical protein